LPPLLVAEVSTLAKVRKVPVGALLAVAWELTKGAVFGPCAAQRPTAPYARRAGSGRR
jgi:hypothetical protein